MTDREKLVKLIRSIQDYGCKTVHEKKSVCAKILTAETVADYLIANGVTVQNWRDAKTDPPAVYRDECRELIPFLVCVDGTEYPFRAYYDGTTWGDGWSKIQVTKWMPLPEPKVSED